MAGALGFTSRREEEVSLFGVIKKYGEEGNRVVRTVWDQRRGNLKWLPPPFAPLGSPTALCHLDLSDVPASATLYQVAADIPDMFTRLGIPPHAWPYFVLRDVDVRELAALLESRGRSCPLRESDRHARLKVLVMGWSWAPFLAHNSLLALLDQAHGPTAELSRMVYGAPTPELTTDEDIVSWAYIDEYGAAGVGPRAEGVPEHLASWAKRTKQTFLAVRVPVHKEQEGVGVEALCAALQTVPFRVGLPRAKAVNLLIATEFILEVSSVLTSPNPKGPYFTEEIRLQTTSLM